METALVSTVVTRLVTEVVAGPVVRATGPSEDQERLTIGDKDNVGGGAAMGVGMAIATASSRAMRAGVTIVMASSRAPGVVVGAPVRGAVRRSLG